MTSTVYKASNPKTFDNGARGKDQLVSPVIERKLGEGHRPVR